MFLHNLKYSLKIILKNRSLIFWTYAFPLIMATFFYMTFSNIESEEKMQVINIAIIENQNFQDDKVYKEVFDSLSKKDTNEQLFNITYTNQENANDMLGKGEITGYLNIDQDTSNVTIKQNGINETILSNVVEQINQNKVIIEDIIEKQVNKEIAKGNFNIDYEKIYKEAIDKINIESSVINDVSGKKLNYIMIEFYNLIAMSCIYGAIISMYAINNMLPNMSKKGMRVGVAPIKKISLIATNILSSYIIQIIGIGIIFIYTVFVLKVDYGPSFVNVAIISMLGSFLGTCFGAFIAIVLKVSENLKIGIVISIAMLGCFLSGLTGVTMKYVIDKNIPIINQLNPLNMITDGLYSLYYYNTLDRYYYNIFCLGIFAIIIIFISIIALRRQKYDSI